MLALGTSLSVLSAFRLARAAVESGTALGIVNIGPTRADALATVKVQEQCSGVLRRLLRHLQQHTVTHRSKLVST